MATDASKLPDDMVENLVKKIRNGSYSVGGDGDAIFYHSLTLNEAIKLTKETIASIVKTYNL